ncbi:hypothetical protein QVG61_10620 [Thiohalobacter sp. IOR34]|uniref:glycine zipper 2TM domain-containing protein n=1 Tax=Thiohalobacter sp. IOR34 TaxID=3057176 RepID=UPI0025AF418A|nr:glycine zipper 2TM domain-containing protein [Thiohalobacter sp. IOR34]WJW74949.1 hypothetical protein QVG61_10620 [Thiohalobacter sp. IOR34]
MKPITQALAPLLLAAALGASPLALADHHGDRYGYAHEDEDYHDYGARHEAHYCPPARRRHREGRVERVIHAPVIVPAPAYGYRQPRQGYRSSTPMILGGIIGGLAGHEMGKGRGKDIATAAGILLGGSIGRDLGH